jgi:hypothetical protein
MKALSFLTVSLFVCLVSFANPVYSNPTEGTGPKTLPDLSQDKDFVSSVDQIFFLQKNTDYTAKENSFKKLYVSVLSLRDRYAVLNDQVNASLMINTGIDKLVQQGRITKSNNSSGNSNIVCIRQLYAAVLACIRTSTSYTAFVNCVREAYAQFLVCLNEE